MTNISLILNNFIVWKLPWYVLLMIYFCCVDEKNVILLVLLDLLEAFDTVDCDVLLDHMFRSLGIQHTSLSWC